MLNIFFSFIAGSKSVSTHEHTSPSEADSLIKCGRQTNRLTNDEQAIHIFLTAYFGDIKMGVLLLPICLH